MWGCDCDWNGDMIEPVFLISSEEIYNHDDGRRSRVCDSIPKGWSGVANES